MPNLAWRALLSVSVRRRPPVLFKLRALKPDQGLSSLTRGYQGRPGASKPDLDGHFGHFQISDFGCQIFYLRFLRFFIFSVFRFWISDFRLQIIMLDFRFQNLVFRFQITDFKFLISDFGFQITDFKLWISDPDL